MAVFFLDQPRPSSSFIQPLTPLRANVALGGRTLLWANQAVLLWEPFRALRADVTLGPQEPLRTLNSLRTAQPNRLPPC